MKTNTFLVVVSALFLTVGCGKREVVHVPAAPGATPEQQKALDKAAVERAKLIAQYGCSSKGISRFNRFVLPALLTIVLTNNTTVPLEVFENGDPMSCVDEEGKWRILTIPPGGVVSKGFYNFSGMRQIVLTVKGICPVDETAKGCLAGQPVGTSTRTFYVYTDGQYHSENWTVDYLEGFRGVH